MAQPRFRVPHTLVLLFAMVVVAFALTYLLPAGQFDRVDHDGHETVVPGSFHRLDDVDPPGWRAILQSVPKGLAAAQAIIFFVFIIGGAFGVLRTTGAADALIGFLLDTIGHYPAVLIAGGIFVFAAGSSTIGMAEEYLPFVPVLLLLCAGLRYDAVTAVGILCCGYSVGYGAAVLNPFTVIIAQEIAGLEPASGMGYRLLLSVIFFAVAFDHVWRYARRVRADPAQSLVAHIDPDPELTDRPRIPLTGAHIAALTVVGLGLLLLIWGLKFDGWYLIEMGELFLGLTIVLGLVTRLGMDRTASEFCKGAAELTTTALLIGVARAIQVVLEEGKVVDTIIHSIAQPLQQLGPVLASVGMLVVQSVCNFFIPSGSGQAYVTMPIMAPLADLVGVSRQVAVLAFQFGDGFSNILVPTSAVLVGILAMARIPYDRWLAFVLPFMFKIWIVAGLALVVAVWIGYA